MKICICYFSGTGNTEYIAKRMAELFTGKNNIVSCRSIEKIKEFSNGDYDLLIIGGPIYSGNVPWKLLQCITKKIPPSPKNRNAIVYTTSAGLLNANGVKSISGRLKKKGYKIIANELFVMPRNYYFHNYLPMEDNYIKKLITDAEDKIRTLVQYVQDGEFLEEKFSKKGYSLLDFNARLFRLFSRFGGKNFSVNENCVRCMKCVRDCPQQNIRLKKNRIRYGSSCILCTRCIHNCPAHAIEYGGELYKQYRLADYLGNKKS